MKLLTRLSQKIHKFLIIDKNFSTLFSLFLTVLLVGMTL